MSKVATLAAFGAVFVVGACSDPAPAPAPEPIPAPVEPEPIAPGKG